MSQSAPQQSTDVFDAAKQLVETLRTLDQHKQAQAIRFASEALGLHAPFGSPAKLSSPQNPPGVPQTRAIDIRQFTEEKAPKSDQQFAAVVAYYYRFEAPEDQRKESIDAATLQHASRLANRARPPRPEMTLNNAKNAGYLDSEGHGKFSINTVGENLVAVTLPGEIGDSPSRRGIRRPTKKQRPVKSTTARKVRK